MPTRRALNLFPNKAAEAWVHLFVGSAYLFPILGGLLSDAFWGKYKTILYLSVIYCMGHCLLACMELVGDTKVVLLLGLTLIAIGSGGIKPCVSAHVGDQFGARTDTCFPEFLVGFICRSIWVLFYPVYLRRFYWKQGGSRVPLVNQYILFLFGWLEKRM